MASDPSPELELTPLVGRPRTVRQLLTTFHLAFVALDPYTPESSWILPTAVRVLQTFAEADVRVALLVTADTDDTVSWLGPHAKEFLVFVDPTRAAVKGFGITRLPAFVHLGMDGTIGAAAEGWAPSEWASVTDRLARITGWKGPMLPAPKDPGAFAGTLV